MLAKDVSPVCCNLETAASAQPFLDAVLKAFLISSARKLGLQKKTTVMRSPEMTEGHYIFDIYLSFFKHQPSDCVLTVCCTIR